MRVEHKHEAITYKYFCDLCGKEMHRIVQCRVCDRHICSSSRDSCSVFDPRDHGDYPDAFCKQCWEAGQEFWNRITSLCECCEEKEIQFAFDEWITKMAEQRSKK